MKLFVQHPEHSSTSATAVPLAEHSLSIAKPLGAFQVTLTLGVPNSQGFWHTWGMATLAHAMGTLLAVLKLDWTRSMWIVHCMALTWKAGGTSAGRPPGYPLMLPAVHWSCTRCTYGKGCKGGCLHSSLPSSASCVRPKWSQKERETIVLPQNLQHVSMQTGSRTFPFLLLMKIDRSVAPLQWLESEIVRIVCSRDSL